MAKQSYTIGQVLTAAQMTTLQANDYNQTVSAKVASYTLVATDAGTRITMSNASATTITVNTALFTAGDTLIITNIGAGVCTITAGTATVSSAGSLALNQYDSGILYFTSTGVSIWNGANPGDITGVTAGTGISGGGTSGAVTVTNSMATAITTNGDIIYGTGSGTFSRLGIGSSAQVLSVSGGIPAWSTPSSGGMTLISTVVPSASTGFSFSSISGSYKHLLLTWSGILFSNSSTVFDVRLNANSTTAYNSMIYYGANTTLTQANGGGATSYNQYIPVFGANVANAGFNNTASGYMWLYDYANTSYAKQCSAAYVYYNSGTATQTQCWNSQMTFDVLTAISSIDITRLSGTGTMTITTNGSVKLWGMA